MAGDKKVDKKFSRRDFVVGSGTAIAGGAITALSPATQVAAAAESYPLSTAYLVYDSKHCAGCYGCMIACSLVHEGEVSLSLSRIQIHRAVLAEYPLDISINVCRQCPEPLCVKNCPTGACHVSAANGNVRMIDQEKCIGCKTCLSSCPHIPHRTVYNAALRKVVKCDLCAVTPYFSKKGGPGGSQACVTTCPAGALKVVAELPPQTDNSGYDVDFAPKPKPVERTLPLPKESSSSAPAEG